MKIMVLVGPPSFLSGPVSFPASVGEACIGLQLVLIEPGVNGQLRPFLGDYGILHFDLVRELRAQKPDGLASLAAADIIEEEYTVIGGEIKLPLASLRVVSPNS